METIANGQAMEQGEWYAARIGEMNTGRKYVRDIY